MKTHNFSAGPSILPPEVFKQASEAVVEYNDSGLSILEISHRSEAFIAILEEAKSLTLELLGLNGKGYQVLFVSGGASMEFLRIPYNLMEQNGKAVYLDTGLWAANAIKEAQRIGEVTIAASSKEKNYNYIPKNYLIDTTADYFHCTSNNTVYGTQMQEFPVTAIPIVCDMSSDIFSRQLDFEKFSLIYAGAQKNIGPAGTTLIVIKESLLERTADKNIPGILNYSEYLTRQGMYNTPVTFAVYTSLLTLRWLKTKGGIAEIEKLNNQKAKLLYDEIDTNPLFTGTAKPEDRSKMNATFLVNNHSHASIFDNLWQEAGISGLHGHRTVGGYRASIYNAMPVDSVKALIEVMQELKNKI